LSGLVRTSKIFWFPADHQFEWLCSQFQNFSLRGWPSIWVPLFTIQFFFDDSESHVHKGVRRS
jgi:hypothetical protein